MSRRPIDPGVENVAAVKAHTRAGSRPVGVMRLAERVGNGRGWHDSLTMELVREPAPPPDI